MPVYKYFEKFLEGIRLNTDLDYFGDKLFHDIFDDTLKQFFFAAIVVVQKHFINTCFIGNFLHAGISGKTSAILINFSGGSAPGVKFFKADNDTA